MLFFRTDGLTDLENSEERRYGENRLERFLFKNNNLLDLLNKFDEFKNSTVETIYFGGGTPSLLTNDELQLLIDAVYENYKVTENPEITLEANPDDLIGTQLSPRAQSRGLWRNIRCYRIRFFYGWRYS